MTYKKTLISGRKRIFIGILIFFMLIIEIIALIKDLEILTLNIVFIPPMLIALLIERKIIIKTNDTNQSIFMGTTFAGTSNGFIPIYQLQCIYIFRKAGGTAQAPSWSFNYASRSSPPVNMLQLLTDKDDLIAEIELYDDKESYKIAYWMQRILKVNIDDYMGREMQTIQPE